MRNPAALAYEQNHSQNSLNSSSSAPKLEHYLENDIHYKSNPSSDHFADLANQPHGIESISSPIEKHQPRDNDISLRSDDHEEFGHRNSHKKNITNVNELHLAETDYSVSATVEPHKNNQNLSGRPILSNHQHAAQSVSSIQRYSAVFEASQCDMAEADQASICSSPEKPTTSTKKNEETFQEVVLTLVQDKATNSKESVCSNGIEIDNGDNDSNLSDVADIRVSENFRPSYSMGMESQTGQSDIQTIRSSVLNEDLERRQLEEESESALTVNAIVEEILSSPTHSLDALVSESDDQRE